MHGDLPFHVAFPYMLIEAGRSAAVRYERLLQCYEAAVRYCAAVQVSDYLAAGCPDDAFNRLLLDRLGRPLSVGHWVELARQVAALQARGVFPAFMPEMPAFFFGRDPGSRAARTEEAEIFDTALVVARNDWAHRDETWSEDDFARRFREQKGPLLDRMLAALGFLARYTLYVPYRGPRPDVVSEALVLMGPHRPPRLATDLALRLSPRVRDHLEYESTAFLADAENPSDPARQLLLYPLSLYVNRDGAEDSFLFDGCDLRRRTIRRLLYRAVGLGTRPLEVTPGSDRDRLVADFRALVDRLEGATRRADGEGGDAEPGSAAAAATAADRSADYFAAQRDVVRGHAARFVGRADVERAFDDFRAAHRRGYFVVAAGPGQGKTAVAAHLVAARGLVHHFVSRTGGRADPRLILRSLLAQLVPLLAGEASGGAGASAGPRGSAAAGRLAGPLPDAVPDLAKRLHDVLAEFAGRGRECVLVVDALDELPDDVPADLPFLVTDALPDGVYVVVTGRPGGRLDRLRQDLALVPHAVHDLAPLGPAEAAAVLRAYAPGLSDADARRVAEAPAGNPLYLRAAADALAADPAFDARRLPPAVEGFFARATAGLRDGGPGGGPNPVLRDVLGLLAAARKPLTLRELAQATGLRQRQVFEQGVRPVRPFLVEGDDGGYAFYHARFHDYVTADVLYEDELPEYHRRLADWLRRPDAAGNDYRLLSLAHHLAAAGDRAALAAAVDGPFLAEKVRRFGYAVLEDVDLLADSLLAADDPAAVPRCVDLIEGLRAVVGGNFIEDAGRVVRAGGGAGGGGGARVAADGVTAAARVPGADAYAAMLPKSTVGADFFELVPSGGRLLAAVGDAPGGGLKGAFTARFVRTLFRRLATAAGPPRPPAKLLADVAAVLAAHPYFEPVSMQCVEVDPAAGVVTVASAGHPYPVLYSARRGRADRLPVRGDLLNFRGVADEPDSRRFDQRRAEAAAGDVLVLVTDGLTESHAGDSGAYGYQFERLLPGLAAGAAEAVVDGIMADWRARPRPGEYVDDVTVIAVVLATT